MLPALPRENLTAVSVSDVGSLGDFAVASICGAIGVADDDEDADEFEEDEGFDDEESYEDDGGEELFDDGYDDDLDDFEDEDEEWA